MAKQQDIPGRIVPRGKKGLLTIVLDDVWTATKLPNTPEGRERARQLKAEMYLGLVNGTKTVRRRRIVATFNEFISEVELERPERYVKDLRYAMREIVRTDIVLTPELIHRQLRAFKTRKLSLAHTEGRTTKTLTSKGKNAVLRNFRVFLNWCTEKEYLAPMTVKRYMHKTDEDPPNPWELQEIEQLIDAFTHGWEGEYYGKKIYIRADPEFADLLRMLWATGGRIKETLTMELDAIDRHTIHYSNKNKRKAEYLPITDALKPVLERQMQRVQLRKQAEIDKARQSPKYKPKPVKMLWKWSYNSKSRLNRRLAEAARKLGITRDGRAFHAIRDAFATNLFDAGVPQHVVKDAMRHSKITTTDKYYRKPKAERLKEALDTLPTPKV